MPKQGNPFINVLTRDLLALFGAHNLKDPYEDGRMPLLPQKIEIHNDWNPDYDSYDADIAIITFQAGAITFSNYVQPICLWNGETDPTQTEGYIGGWGQSKNLKNFFKEIPKKLKVPIHTNEFCFLTTKDLVDLASNRTFCAGRGDGTGIYTGDFGGGLSVKVRSTFYFRGIVSSCLYYQLSCDLSKYSIFTDVLKFKLWIDEIMSEEKNVLRCTIDRHLWRDLLESKELQTCKINDQELDGEGFSVASDLNLNIQAFSIEGNKEVEFLPENIVESFPGLIAYRVIRCSIKTVNRKHFKGLNNLERLELQGNQIDSIQGDSFKDLARLVMLALNYNKIKIIDSSWFQSLETLRQLRIGGNQIELLDEKMFNILRNIREISLDNNKLSAVPANLFRDNLKLEEIRLGRNKIKTISPTMFDHLNNLTYVDLRSNVCVNDFFYQQRFDEMKNVLRINCTPLDQ